MNRAPTTSETTSVFVSTATAARAPPGQGSPGVAHENLGGVGVVPQEADATAGAGRAEDGEIDVTAQEADGGHDEHGHHDRTAGESVEPSVRLTALDIPASSKNTKMR